MIVYSTCTIELEENEAVIDAFLNNHPEFSVENASEYIPKETVNERGFMELFPHIHKTDGAFAARLVRKS